MNEVHVRISDDYEQNRPVKARAMFNYLASRKLLRTELNVNDPAGKWESIPQEVRDAFESMVALYAEPNVVTGP